RTLIRACYERICPGGWLLVNFPSADGIFFQASLLLDRFGIEAPLARLWQKDLPSPHVSYFTARQLQYLADANGFTKRAEISLESFRLSGLWDRINYTG